MKNRVFKQKGAALPVSLFILTVMTLVGVSAMNNTLMEEKMAGNIRNVHKAFHSAESALENGEAFLNQVNLPSFENASGLYQVTTNGTHRWETVNWASDSETRLSANSLSNVSQAPRYIIEELPSVDMPESSKVLGFTPGDRVEYYRVTARGTGTNTNSVVIVQSTYRR